LSKTKAELETTERSATEVFLLTVFSMRLPRCSAHGRGRVAGYFPILAKNPG
jgi:hypothetical protein